MIPTHQGLCAGQNGVFGANVEFWLEVHHKAVAFQGRLEVLQQALPKQLRLMHLRVVDANCLLITASYSVCGNLCVVKAAVDLERLVYLRIHAHAQTDPVLRNLLVHEALRRLVQYALVVFGVGAVDKEYVRFATAAHTADLTGYLTDALSDSGEHAVSILLSVALVQHVEVVDVQHDGIHGHIGVMLVVHPNVAQEVVEVKQVRQAVALGGLDDVALLR